MRLLVLSSSDRPVPGELLELLAAEAQVDSFELPAAPQPLSGPAALAHTLTAVEREAEARRPDAALIDLDGDAALAAALVFAKLPIPVARLAVPPAAEAHLAELLCDAVLDDADSALAWLRT